MTLENVLRKYFSQMVFGAKLNLASPIHDVKDTNSCVMRRNLPQWVQVIMLTNIILIINKVVVAQTPLVTVQFAHPQYNCSNNQYCLDVEFQSNLPG